MRKQTLRHLKPLLLYVYYGGFKCVLVPPHLRGNKNSMLTCTYLSNGWGNDDGTFLFDENIQSYYQRMVGYDWALQSLPQHSI